MLKLNAICDKIEKISIAEGIKLTTHILHIFIINPTAGKGVKSELISEKIGDACRAAGANYEIYETTRKNDATDFVKKKISIKPEGETYRFYACGGDGTLGEIVNGVVDEQYGKPIPGVEVGCIPYGTGNDFIRNFTTNEYFHDITKQILGEAVAIDCFAVNGKYAINMVNVGFDCDVVSKTAELKLKPYIPKNFAYIAGVIVVLRRNLGKKISVILDDQTQRRDEFQLCAVANGGFCGGGFHSAPRCSLNDGLIDVSLIKKVSRTKFLTLVGPYKKGTHLETAGGKKIITYIQCKSVIFKFDSETDVCVDGEISKMSHAEFRVVPNALSFSLPVGVKPLNDRVIIENKSEEKYAAR